MEYTTLGNTGMTVSRICLGCMSFGTDREWMLEPEESTELIDHAIDLGDQLLRYRERLLDG